MAAAPVVDLVYDANNIGEYCAREEFRGGFFVEERSDQSLFLDSEYQARLADTSITAVDRERSQAEYEAKRQALPLQYRLVFVKSEPCDAIPQIVITKALTGVLATWASESEMKRGVLNHHVEVLTPGILEVGVGLENLRLLRADLVRTAMWRIISNVDAVQAIPGAALIRFGEDQVTFMEVRGKLVDLVRSRLEPLVAFAGQSMARESLSWVTETVASAEREEKAAEGIAAANQVALQLYSGLNRAARPGSGDAPQATATASDVQTLSPQIDSTFIDRIVEMSAGNTAFRQELTRSMVKATGEAVAARERAEYYRRLLQSLREPGGSLMSSEAIDKRFDEIVGQGKALTKQFNELYEEFSRVSLRAAAAMYQTEKPVTTEVLREFTLRRLLLVVVGAFFAALLMTFGYLVIRDRMRMEAREPPRAGV